MIEGIDKEFRFQASALTLRAQRQQVLASNIANADTPGYKARDIDFARALEQATQASEAAPGLALARTAPAHVAPAAQGAALPQTVTGSDAGGALDGNSVDMDTERTRFADNALRYEATLSFLNGKIRTLLSAIQG